MASKRKHQLLSEEIEDLLDNSDFELSSDEDPKELGNLRSRIDSSSDDDDTDGSIATASIDKGDSLIVRGQRPSLDDAHDVASPATSHAEPSNPADQTFVPRRRGLRPRKQVRVTISSDDSDNESLGNVSLPTASSTPVLNRNRRLPQPQAPPRRVLWKNTREFEPLPPAPYFVEPLPAPQEKSPKEYFDKYLDDEFFQILSTNTNIRVLMETGRDLATSPEEMRKFVGVSFVMSIYKLPRIRMYWTTATRIPHVADHMTRDRYFKIRNNLKVVNDLEVSDANKQYKFWKLQPMLEKIRDGCLNNTRSVAVSIDEQMVPFWGHVSMRQYIRGKPNPCGLKNFVMTSTDGLPLDFFLYEGKGCSVSANPAHEDFDIGGKVILRLAQTLPEGTIIYMDRYFTSIPLLDELHATHSIQGTGTLQNSRIQESVRFKTDLAMKREGRGAIDQVVRSDGQVAIVKWYDNKPVILASSVEGCQPTDVCRRWCKKEKKYVDVVRPGIVKNYNEKMGGVDFLDRIISYYRIDARTRKWTIRLFMHMLDFVAAAGWIQYRRDQGHLETRQKDQLDFLDFKMKLAQSLIHFTPMEVSSEEEEEEEEQPLVARRVAHPPDDFRKKGTLHLPEIPAKETKSQRCRLTGCPGTSARVRCTACKVHLCFTAHRNCFLAYHRL